MLKLSVLVPDDTINYIKNPSARFDTTGWSTFGSTLSRSLDYARFGVASLKVVTSGAALREGIYFRVSNLTGVGDPVTVSAYVRGTGKVRIRVIDNPIGKEAASLPVQLRADRWTRISATLSPITGRDDVRLYIELIESAVAARTFYVGGAQMERRYYMTTFCDGDQKDCTWDGVEHNSLSRRTAYTRAGGRWVQLAGEERAVEDLYTTEISGLGMPPLQNNTQPYALAPGSYYQNTKVTDRVVTLTFHARHKDLFNRDRAISLSALHQLRQMLIDVLKPDLTSGGQDIWYEYVDGERTLYFQARYEGGLEGDWDVRNEWINSFPVRLLSVSPYMYEDSLEAAQLDFQEAVNFNYVMGRIDGQWSRMNFGVNNTVEAFARGARGELYMSGTFTVANNNASALSPLITANRITYWDGERWQTLSTGAATGTIYAVAVGPNGYVYVGGTFLTIGGVSTTFVAYWNGSAWNAMSGLGGNGVYALAVSPNGDVYAGGDFTMSASAANVARWDGFQWRRIGGASGGLDTGSGSRPGIYAVAVSSDGALVYFGGYFTATIGSPVVTTKRIIQYTVSTNAFSAMGSGLGSAASDYVDAIVITSGGLVYAAGTFTVSGSDTLNYIAQWNGSTWLPLGSGLNGAVTGMSLSSKSELYVVGSFTTAGGRNCPNIAVWNGSSWLNVDMKLQTTGFSTSGAVLVHPKTGNIFVGGNLTATNPVLVSGINLINNPGSAEVQPVIYISGSGYLRWIENQSTGKRIWLDMSIASLEEVIIDFAAGTVISSGRGNILYTILAGSDFGDFSLIPGENKLAIFMTNDVGATMQISFQPRHWSIDATQLVESL